MEGITCGGIGNPDNSTAEPTTDATPRKIEAFDTMGPNNRVTGSLVTNDLVLTEAGTYRVDGHCSFSGTLGKIFKVSVYRNSTAIGVPLKRKMGTGGDVGDGSFEAFYGVFAVGDTISARHWSMDGGTSFTAETISLFATRKK